MISETLMIHDVEVHIYYDEDAESPRNWDNLGIFVTAHRRVTGDCELSYDANSIDEAFKWHLRDRGLKLKDIIYTPVYMYKHSGIALSTTSFSCPWDSGPLGYIYIVKSNYRKWYKIQRITQHHLNKAHDILRQEIELMSAYYNGEVYGYCIPSLDESCWGFYGHDHNESGLIQAATASILHYKTAA